MKKEYPATHSMWTAWFAVDEDDNVAIMECEDEGPSPRGYSMDVSVELLLEDENVAFTPGQKKIIEESGVQKDWSSTANFFGYEDEPPLNKTLPLYFYLQSVDKYGFSDKMLSPTQCECIKYDQLSENMKKQVFRLPLRFRDADKIQLAQYLPCQYWYELPLYMDGHRCSPARFPDNKTYLVFPDKSHEPIELDEAFDNHDVYLYDKCNRHLEEYRVNGKRGYQEYYSQNGAPIYVRFGDYPWGVNARYIKEEDAETIELVEQRKI